MPSVSGGGGGVSSNAPRIVMGTCATAKPIDPRALDVNHGFTTRSTMFANQFMEPLGNTLPACVVVKDNVADVHGLLCALVGTANVFVASMCHGNATFDAHLQILSLDCGALVCEANGDMENSCGGSATSSSSAAN